MVNIVFYYYTVVYSWEIYTLLYFLCYCFKLLNIDKPAETVLGCVCAAITCKGSQETSIVCHETEVLSKHGSTADMKIYTFKCVDYCSGHVTRFNLLNNWLKASIFSDGNVHFKLYDFTSS